MVRIGFPLKGSIRATIRATIIFRMGFWGPSYYNHNMEPPKIV